MSPASNLTVESAQRRRAFRVLFLCLIAVGLGQSMLFAILPPAARDIGLSPFQVSTIFAISATIWVFVSPMWGRRSDVVGRRPIIVIGLLGFALSMVLLATVIAVGTAKLLPVLAVYLLMVASRSVFALLGSGTGPASQAYVADRTDTGHRSAGVSLINGAVGLGQTVGPAAGAALAFLGLVAPLYFAAALAVLSAVVIGFLLPETDAPLASQAQRPRRMPISDRRVRPFIVVGATLQAVQATTTITIAFFLQDTLGLTAQQTVQYAGAGLTAVALAGLFTQLVLVQRYRPSSRRMVLIGLPLIVSALTLLVLRVGFAVDLAALATLGLGLGLARPGNAAGASLAVEAHEQGAVAGILSGIVVVGNIVGPMAGTAIFGLTPVAPYVLDALLVAAVLVFAIRKQ